MRGNNTDMMGVPGQTQWEWPDGRQFAWNTLAEMGMTPGDMRDIMLQIYRNHDPNELREPGLKGAAAVEHDYEHRPGHAQNDFEEKQALQEEHFEQQQRDQQQWEEDQRLQQQQWEEKQRLEERMFEEKRMQEQAAQNQPADNSQNMRIGMMPLGFAGALLGFGLTNEAVTTTGQILSPHTEALGDQMMVAGNTGGGDSLLADARNALNVGGPSTDIMVTGPNKTNDFIPGVVPEPGTGLGQTPLAPNILPVPGMTPSMG